jgi:hypothetical protein
VIFPDPLDPGLFELLQLGDVLCQGCFVVLFGFVSLVGGAGCSLFSRSEGFLRCCILSFQLLDAEFEFAQLLQRPN